MRITPRLVLAAGIWLGMTAFLRAGDRETALLDQAIKAHGGAAALTRAQTVVRSATGTLFLSGAVTFTGETTLSLPGRARLSVKLDKGGQAIIVLNGDRAWRSAGGAVTDMPKDGVDELKEEVYVEWLATLVPLKKAGFTLAPVADQTVNGKAAAGMKVTSKGHGDVRLYFDKDSGLLVKIERQSREAGIAVNKEYVFSGFKDFDGVKLPTKRVELLNGKKFDDATTTAYKFLGKVDDATFGRP